MRRHAQAMGIGPWFLLQRFTPAEALYRDRPTALVISVAFSYSGETMLELIQQHDNSASVFRDVVDKRGYGLHHLGMGAAEYDTALQSHRANGWVPAFSARTTGRLVMLEHDDFPYLLELLEMDPKRAALFASIRTAAHGWNGAEPIRRL